MMDVVSRAYDLEESILIEGSSKLLILPFVRNAIEIMLRDDKKRVMEYLKMVKQFEILYEEVPN